MTERYSGPGLWARQSRVDAPLLALIGVVVLLASFLLTAGPLASAAVATAEVRSTVADFAAVRRDLSGSATFGDPLGGGVAPTAGDLFEVVEAALDAAAIQRPLADLLGDPQWVVRTNELPVDVPGSTAVNLARLTATDDWSTRVRFVEGGAPRGWTGTDPPPAAAADPLPVAISQDVAAAYQVGVGDVVESFPVALAVTGVFAVADARDAFWRHVPNGVSPGERRGDDGRRIVSADVYIDTASIAGLRETFSSGVLEFWYPLDVDGLVFAQSPQIATQIRQAAAISTTIPLPAQGAVTINAALADDLEVIAARVNAASAVFALVAAGPLGVVLAVIALGARSVLHRRANALALTSARGVNGVGLRAALAAEGALVSVPAAAAGVVLAVLVVGAGGGLVLWPAALLAIATPVVLAAVIPLRDDRSAVTARWVAEVLVIGLAAVSVFLLLRRGVVVSTGGVDPLSAAAPLLVAAAVSIGVLRLYPLAMSVVQRTSHARPGPVAVVGSARAVRAPALGFAAAFALVVGMSIATFSAALWTTLITAFAIAPTSRDATFDGANPLAAALLWVLGLGIVVPLVFCGCAVAVAASRGRGGAVAVLRVLGFSPAQVRGLISWEFVPVAAMAGIAGTVLGLIEVAVLGSALDLPSLLGRPASLTADPWLTLAVVAVFAAMTILTAWAATAAARRRGTASTLRMGAE